MGFKVGRLGHPEEMRGGHPLGLEGSRTAIGKKEGDMMRQGLRGKTASGQAFTQASQVSLPSA